MTRKCSHCTHNGHNSRTCPNRGVMLFGVRLGDGPIQKSASMGNLSAASGSIRKSASMGNLSHAPASGGGASPVDGQEPADGGYASEDLAQRAARERKRGTPWTEEEHRLFLLGLQKLGKGDWRGISRNYVITRTPTQVASHAQKYFIRQSNMSRRKRRSSVFDMVPDETAEPEPIPMNYQESEAQNNNPSQAPPTATPKEEFKAVDTNNSVIGEAKNQQPTAAHCTYPVPLPVYFPPPFMPYPFCVWPGYAADISVQKAYEIFKPTALHTRNPVNVDELGGMSKLNIGGSSGESALLGGSKRQSAFHANRPTGPLS